ncbi:hypothetical protein ABVT39_018257 [Epinephelus coioides]
MISRMVEVLSVMIKPAAPTQRTADLITGNAKNWGHNTCLILMDHYEAGLEKLLEELKDLLTADWKSAFEVAVRWAKRNLPRITREVINQAEALITATLDIEEVPVQVPQQTGVPAQTQRAPQSTTGDPTPAQIPQPIGVLTQVHRARQPTMGDAPPAQVPQRTGVSDQTQRAVQPIIKGPAVIKVDRIEEEPDWFVPPRAEPVREGRLTQRVARTTRGVVLTEDNLLQESEFQDPEESRVMEAPIQDSTHIELEALFDELHAEELREEAEARARYTLGPDQVQVHREISPEEEIFQESFDHFTSPEPQRFKVTRHRNTQRKLTDWDLRVRRKVLIIGDSNLSNIPDFFNKDLQIDSFPGSHFRHGQALMEKTVVPDDLVVERRSSCHLGSTAGETSQKKPLSRIFKGPSGPRRESFPMQRSGSP